jgi:chemotaxis protein MotB
MSGHGGKKKRGDDHGDHPDERWLVTYADLMTLLVALFMVLFSISSVNKSKLESLQHSLQDAFSGKVLPGGQSIKESGGVMNIKTPSASPKESSLQPYVGSPKSDKSVSKTSAGAQGNAEEQAFEKLKKQLDQVASKSGLSGKIKVTVTDDGLLIRLLTDKLLFDSGSATPRPQALPLLKDVASLLKTQAGHQLIISGNTDNQPIHSGRFADNLDLSTGRANAIFRAFAHDGISPLRMTSAGRGDYQPVASNDSEAGRSLNRRVEILVPRVAKVSSSPASKIPSIKPNFAPTK